MFIPVLAAFLIAADSAADNNAVLDQLEHLIAENILDELADTTDEGSEVSAAIRYMIPVPIRVVIPVPIQNPEREREQEREREEREREQREREQQERERREREQQERERRERQRERQREQRERQREREPIVAVPIGATPGRWGPQWRPVGPPVIAVPIGSASPYPLPGRDNKDSRALAGAQKAKAAAVARRTRSIDEDELKADEPDQEELTSDMSQKEAAAKGFHGSDNPLKVSSKMGRKGFKSEKPLRPKRQIGGGYHIRGGYIRPATVIVPAPPPGQVVVAPAVPSTQVVHVPVYVPVPVKTVG